MNLKQRIEAMKIPGCNGPARNRRPQIDTTPTRLLREVGHSDKPSSLGAFI